MKKPKHYTGAADEYPYVCVKCSDDSATEVCQKCEKLCWIKPNHWKLKWRTTAKIYGALQKWSETNWIDVTDDDPPKEVLIGGGAHPVMTENFTAAVEVAGPGCTRLTIEPVFPMPRKSFVQAMQDGDIPQAEIDAVRSKNQPDTLHTPEVENAPQPSQTQAIWQPETFRNCSTDDFEVRAGTREHYIEVVFKTKPDDNIRRRLKAAGYRWSPKNNVWYGKSLDLPLFLKGHIYRDGFEMKPEASIPDSAGPEIAQIGMVRKKLHGLRINDVDGTFLIVHEGSGMDIGFPAFKEYKEAFETMEKCLALADWTKPADDVMAIEGMADMLSDLLPPEMMDVPEEEPAPAVNVIQGNFTQSLRERLLQKARSLIRR